MKKIVICGVPFSDNLGDGVIAVSLEHLLRTKYPEAEIRLLDIAGRANFTGSVIRGGAGFSIFRVLPHLIQQAIVMLMCSVRYLLKWRSLWSRTLADADLVVVGGGQLLCDVAANFPAKLYLLGRNLKGRQVVFFGVGVASGWSMLGRALVSRFLVMASPRSVVVRDADSAKNLEANFGWPADLRGITPDPAVCASQAFAADLSRVKNWDVGLCISDVDSLGFNFGGTQVTQDSVAYFCEIYGTLRAQGKAVMLFINGAAEDLRTAETVAERLRQKYDDVRLVVPRDPHKLVAAISECRTLIAHRMHANIVAYSLAIPSVGIEWDKKMRGFFSFVRREDYLVPFAASPGEIVSTWRRLRPLAVEDQGVIDAELARSVAEYL